MSMFTETLGSTTLHALTYSVLYPFSDYDYLLNLIGVDTRAGKVHALTMHDIDPHKATALQTLDRSRLEKFLLAACTINHEQNHVRQVGANPFVAMVALNAAHHLNACLISLRDIAMRGVCALPVPLIQYRRKSIISWPNRLANLACHLRDVIEWDSLVAGTQSRSIGDAKVLWKAFSDSGDKPTFVTRLTASDASSPCGLTALHLLEADCRRYDLRTLAFWKLVGVPSDVIDNVVHSLMGAPGYHEALSYFMKELPQLRHPDEAFLIAIHMALWTDVFENSAGKQLYWEDFQPVWRFKRIVDSFKKQPHRLLNLSSYDEVVSNLCSDFGWRSPKELASVHIGQYYTMGTENAIEEDVAQRHVAYCKNLLSKGLEAFPQDVKLAQRETPWIRFDGERVLFDNPPDGLSEAIILNLILEFLIADTVFHTGNLESFKALLRSCVAQERAAGNLNEESLDKVFGGWIANAVGVDLKQWVAA